MRTIDADALIEDLEYDVGLDARMLDDMDFVGIERKLVQFDKDCKQNAIDLLQHAPTVELEIIRCKECMHNGSFDTDCPIDWNGKEYCSFAERRTDEQAVSE